MPLAPAPGAIVGGYSALPFAIASPFTGPLPLRDDRDTYSIGGELFPTDRLGFRIGLARSTSDYTNDDTYDVAATWFFKRGVAVELTLARTEHELGPLKRNIDRGELRLFGRL